MDATPNAAAEAAMVFLVFMAFDDILELRGCGYQDYSQPLGLLSIPVPRAVRLAPYRYGGDDGDGVGHDSKDRVDRFQQPHRTSSLEMSGRACSRHKLI